MDSLLTLGQSVLDQKLPLDERLEALHSYVETMALVLNDEPALKALTPETGQKLQSTHDEVLKVAQELLGSTGDELRALNTRGKAILKYTDTLPKSVSVYSNKKG